MRHNQATHPLQVDRLWLLAVVLGTVQLLFNFNVFAEQQVDDKDVVELRARLGITFCEEKKKRREKLKQLVNNGGGGDADGRIAGAETSSHRASNENASRKPKVLLT